MVRRRAPLYRCGKALHFRLQRQLAVWSNHLQPQAGESRRIQILLGSAKFEVEKQAALSRSHLLRYGNHATVLLPSPGSWPAVSQETLWRYANHDRPRLAP